MNLKGFFIGWLFTILAGLIILAHLVVPHHHHFELAHSSEHQTNCEESTQEKSNKNPVSHCHAFNILISERATNTSLNKTQSEDFSFCTSGTNNNIEISPDIKVLTNIYDYQTISIKLYFFTSHSLRAPPAIG